MAAGDGDDPSDLIEKERRKLAQRLDEVARLCESGLPPAAFYGEMLQRLLESLAAVAGAVWMRTAQGNLQQQYQINVQQTGLDTSEAGRQSHDALLRAVFMSGQPQALQPRSTVGPAEEGRPAPGNPSDCILLLVPIRQNDQVIGLIEVFQGPRRPANAIQGFLQYMTMMADFAGRYQRNQLASQLVGQQQLWTQLEAYARSIHGSLSPTAVSFHIANEGRRLIECDRVCVAVRRSGEKCRVEAVSGTDVVEHRSNLVRRMRELCDAVLEWGERLIYTGTKDDSLPPRVLSTMDAFLHESPSKMLIVMPQRDEREGDGKDRPRQPPRSVLVVENFETPADTLQTVARLDVVSRHATPALYNAIEHYRIPMRFLWMPLARLQEGLGGKTRAIVLAVVLLLSLVGAGLYAFPYPLKMAVTGKALPVVRQVVYSPTTGTVKGFEVEPNDGISEGRSLALLYDSTLEKNIEELTQQMNAAKLEAQGYEGHLDRTVPEAEKSEHRSKAALKRSEQESKRQQLNELVRRTNSLKDRPGYFSLIAPTMTGEERDRVFERRWNVLSSNFKTDFLGKEVRPSEPIMRLGAKQGPWEVELKIPQKHIGQVLRAYERLAPGEPLDVDYLLASNTRKLLKGKLYRDRIAGEAEPNREEATDAEPVVLAYLRIDGDDIPEEYRARIEELTANTDVNAKIRCGNARAGYALFYGVWEFLYEKVIFYLF